MNKVDFSPFIQIGLLSLLLTACAHNSDPEPDLQPAACFSMPPIATRNAMVAFDAACSQNANSYFWDFGDGETSDEQSPIHAFKLDGEYTVKLRVSRDDKKDSVAQTIIVKLSDFDTKCLPEYVLGAAIWPAREDDSVTFSYSSGKLADVTWYYRSVSKVHDMRMTCDYDIEGRLSQFKMVNVVAFDPVQEEEVSTLYVQYNASNQPSRIDWVNVEGDSLKNWAYHYDDSGRLSEIQYRIHTSHFQIKYQYDLNGNTEKVFYTSASLFTNFLARHNTVFDNSLPFYSASKELRLFFEYILQTAPYRNNPGKFRIFSSVNMGGDIALYGSGPVENIEGMEMQHEIILNENGLSTGFRIQNYGTDYFTGDIYYRKVGYTCAN